MIVKSGMRNKRGNVWRILLLAGAVTAQAAEPDNVPSVLENGAIVRRNGVYFNNRPLYASSDAPVAPYYYVLTGDRPLVRFGGPPWVDGHFVLGFQKKGGGSKWLLDFKSVEFRYFGGRVEWVASDPEFPGVTISLQALPLGLGSGLAAQAKVTGSVAGDCLVWIFGAAYREDHVARIDALVTPGPRSLGFEATQAQGNRVEVKDGVIRIEPPHGDNLRYTLATCNTPSEIRITDASLWKTPGTLLAGTAGSCPIASGITPLTGDKPIIWSARCRPETDKTAVASNSETDFRMAMERVEKLNNRVVSQTPDARFDFMVRAVSHSMDGVWRGTTYAHGGSGPYPMPFLGW